MGKQRGGKREGSGRKRGLETITIRIPKILQEDVKKFVKLKMKGYEKD